MSLHFDTTMTISNASAREIFEDLRANRSRAEFGFGERMAIVNVDIQQAYTRPDLFPKTCLLYTSPSPRDLSTSRMPSSA